MRIKPVLMTLVFLDLVAVTVWALFTGSLFEFVQRVLHDPWAIQIAFDFCIAVGFAGYWLYKDAKTQGLNPWPWLIALPFTGSLSLLLYAVRRVWSESTPAPRRTPVAA